MNQTTASATPDIARRRYPEFDILRALSMLLMVVAHTWEELGIFSHEAYEAFYPAFSYSYALIGPGMLMLCLGTNLAFGKPKTPGQLARRGIFFLLVDGILNLVRFGFPALVLACFGNRDYIPVFLDNLLGSDIYAFVGALFLLFALFQKLRLSSLSIIFIALGMLTANNFLDYHQIGFVNDLLECFMGRFVYTGANSFFSLLPWFIFPAVGFAFGTRFKEKTTAEQNSFSRKVFVGSAVGFAALSMALQNYGVSPGIANITVTDYRTDLLNIALMILLSGMVFGPAHQIALRWPDSWFVAACQNTSRVIMPFYVIQWIIIGWAGTFLKGFRIYGIFTNVLRINIAALLIILVSLFLAFLFTKTMAARKGKAQK